MNFNTLSHLTKNFLLALEAKVSDDAYSNEEYFTKNVFLQRKSKKK